MYYSKDEGKSRINLQASYRLFLFAWNFAERDIQRFVHASAPIICAKVPMVLYLLELQYSVPDTLLYYITIQYFIFCVFFVFLTIHKHKYRGNMIVLSARIEGREVGCMSEISMIMHVESIQS